VSLRLQRRSRRDTPDKETSMNVWSAFTWLAEPDDWSVDERGQLTWRTRPESDYWRHTGGVEGADDGDAYLTRIEGDFQFSMDLTTRLTSPYDQAGLMVRVDDRHWIKAGVELDDGNWFSVVATRETSDWSKQPSGSRVMFRIWRQGDTVRVGLGDELGMLLVRELVFDGAVAVGPYSCSPKGPGFAVSVAVSEIADSNWEFSATAG
jgi:regulation of enolase protein 1 (concanavalin A-like superfamily)